MRQIKTKGYDITVASEVMAILCLSNDMEDLERRLGNIVVGYCRDKTAVTCRDLNAEGAMTALLRVRFSHFENHLDLAQNNLTLGNFNFSTRIIGRKTPALRLNPANKS